MSALNCLGDQAIDKRKFIGTRPNDETIRPGPVSAPALKDSNTGVVRHVDQTHTRYTDIHSNTAKQVDRGFKTTSPAMSKSLKINSSST